MTYERKAIWTTVLEGIVEGERKEYGIRQSAENYGMNEHVQYIHASMDLSLCGRVMYNDPVSYVSKQFQYHRLSFYLVSTGYWAVDITAPFDASTMKVTTQ